MKRLVLSLLLVIGLVCSIVPLAVASPPQGPEKSAGVVTACKGGRLGNVDLWACVASVQTCTNLKKPCPIYVPCKSRDYCPPEN